jgi:hypothetical protein
MAPAVRRPETARSRSAARRMRGVLIGLVLFAVPATSAHASITVANTSDAGAGSLRQAVVDASPGETVVLPAGIYTLTSGELAVAKSITISGHATADTTIRAGGAFRVLHTSGAANTVALSGLTLRDGHVVSSIAEGGGVLNQGAALTLSDVVVTNNRADSDGVPGGPGSIAYGGGILNDSGALTLLHTQVTGNTATASGGDGIPPNGNGGPGSIAEGGGLMSSAALTILDTTFSGNAATATGGNGAGTGNGGPGSIVYAGGVLIAPGTLTASVTASSITGNVGDASGGAHGPAGGTAGAGGVVQGGGVKATVSSSVFTFGNVTVAANIARSSPTGTVQGGGVFAAASGSGKIHLTNATLSANSASGPAGATGGNLQPSGSVELRDTILAAGMAMAGAQNCSATTTSLGHNLEDTTPSQCGLVAIGDRVGADPLLAPLQANGGPTSTMALLGASPAIDAGDTSCLGSDQRGVARPQGAACDIGAYELASGAAMTGVASAVTTVSANVGGTATNPDAMGATASFQYGPTMAYGLATAIQPVAPAAGARPLAASLVALAPATTYHFRLVMTNAAGTAVGADQTFVTSANPAASLPLLSRPMVSIALPVLSGLSLSPTSFRAKASAKAVTKHAGTRVKYKLTRIARVRFTVERSTKGRRVHGTCAAAKRSNVGKPACVRYVTVAGSLTRASTAGANSFRFAGRLGGRALRLGRYRLRAVATDLGSRRSVPKLVRFRIAKR